MPNGENISVKSGSFILSGIHLYSYQNPSCWCQCSPQSRTTDSKMHIYHI